MEIEAFNGYIPNYPIMMSTSADHGNVYASYNYQFPSDNLVWNGPETAFVNQSDLSISSPTITSASFYYQSSNINSTNSDETQAASSASAESSVKSKRGRKKASKKVEEPKVDKRTENRSSESPPNPTVMKKRRLAANARERRRMNGLNTAFDK